MVRVNERDALLDLTAHAIVQMRAWANPAEPDPRAVQEWATAFHNVPTRMKEVLREGGDLQVVLDELWAENEYLPRVREGIAAWVESRGMDLHEMFRSA